VHCVNEFRPARHILGCLAHKGTRAMIRHAIIETSWGYFGIAGTEDALCRTCLPVETPDIARQVLLNGLNMTADRLPYQSDLLPSLQTGILAYFNDQTVDFSTGIAVDLGKMGNFDKAVLQACARIKPGSTTTYGQLARTIGYPHAARAVGNALARNPIPLIIPCHRVLRSDGGLGGFSAIGATELKQRLLDLERSHERVSAVCAK
jgi:methylated-DNA-[protein]-cysteine S-methyltransferase